MTVAEDTHEQLTEAQYKAVQTDSRDVLVIAGAGSGKTRVLTHRIAWLLNNGALPEELLVLTFTRAAAREMRERIQNLLGKEHVDDYILWERMRIGTFHSVALGILTEYGHALGYDRDRITVCTPEDSEMLLKRVSQELGYYDGDKTWKDKLSFAKVKRALEALYCGRGLYGGTLSLKGDERRAIENIVFEYWSQLCQLNTLDFGLILQETRRLLSEHEDIRTALQGTIRHVLVDELQDTNATQYNLHEFFAPPATFFGVGDFRQSIYGFRGARPDLMFERHPDAEIIDLQDNFRSGKKIVSIANNLIAHNGDDRARPMISANGSDGKLVQAMGRSADIVQSLWYLHDEHGYAWSDMAVMARNHRLLARLEEVCREQQVPVHRVRPAGDMLKDEKLGLIEAALRLCVNPQDDLAFLQLADPCGIGGEKYSAIRVIAAEREIGLLEAFSIHDSGMITNPLLQYIAEYTCSPEVVDNAGRVIRELSLRLSGCYDDTVRGYMSAAADAMVEHYRIGGLRLREALHWLSLRDSQDDLPDGGDDLVTLLTVHAAKGLEYPCVLVAELNEGTFPSTLSLREDGGVEEERRLAYVAFTRAKETLVLHHRRREDQATGKNGRELREPSRFLREIG